MSSDELSGEARRLFAEFLERLDSPQPLDPDWLFGSHPEVEGDLRQLHGDWAEARALMQGLRKDLPRGEVDPADASSSHESVVRALSDLARRDHGADRYREVERLGAGGMGVVTRVWDGDLRRDLAMKVMRGEAIARGESGSDQDLRKLDRFLDEAQVTAQLDHPGIPPVHEMGVDSEGRIYFTMKLVRGETLADVIDRVHAGQAGWNMARALGVMVKVCEAMAYAHSKHVVHRDLKPDNVMVGHFGAVYVMDWGLARVLGCPARRW